MINCIKCYGSFVKEQDTSNYGKTTYDKNFFPSEITKILIRTTFSNHCGFTTAANHIELDRGQLFCVGTNSRYEYKLGVERVDKFDIEAGFDTIKKGKNNTTKSKKEKGLKCFLLFIYKKIMKMIKVPPVLFPEIKRILAKMRLNVPNNLNLKCDTPRGTSGNEELNNILIIRME